MHRSSQRFLNWINDILILWKFWSIFQVFRNGFPCYCETITMNKSSIKKHLYQAYPGFSAQRIKLGIKVKTISIGPGGETVGLDPRKWLTQKESSPTYTLIYSGKVALVSVDAEGKPMGVIIEDRNIYQTQKMIFDFIWQQL